MPSVNSRREEWTVKNNTISPITIGDLPKVSAIRPGKILNLLRYSTKQEIGQSKVLVDLLKDRYLVLKKSIQKVEKQTITTATGIIDWSGATHAKPKIYSQNAEPDIANDSIAYWVDTNNSNRNWLIIDVGGVQKKVELT